MPHQHATACPSNTAFAGLRNTRKIRGDRFMSEVRRQVAMPPRPSWAWQDAGACRGKDVVLFFGPDGERQPGREVRERKADAACAAGPVRAEALTHAVSRPATYGTRRGLH